MPKVSKFEMYIGGKFYVFPIFYTQKYLFEVKEFPTDVVRYTKVNLYGYSTERSLIDSLRNAVRTFEDETKHSRKVIAYTFKASRPLTHSAGTQISANSHSLVRKPQISKKLGDLKEGYSSSSNFGVSLVYKILLETDKKGVKSYNDM